MSFQDSNVNLRVPKRFSMGGLRVFEKDSLWGLESASVALAGLG